MSFNSGVKGRGRAR